ncbi:helix-turn-helix transcriptional regulator [Maritalea porphyrae]|uniref:HTH luxR-type domain-containing protein n=1 Tax=Maritalea porphyrae TaxID=880732 RepID=A0ABQ5US01_9HYPH|nr:helix-turn-helix transcriptional regulator [Maritalea porphyrae]GLQ18060.1 hypothetical protein GCM10007879_23090 [Maritalea porphyrae]
MDGQYWSEFVGMLSQVTGVPQSFLIGIGANAQQPFQPITPNLSPEFLASYGSTYGRHDSWLQAFQQLGANKIWSTDEVLGRREVERSVLYNEWLRPQEDIVRGVGGVVSREYSRTIVLGANIRRNDNDFLEREWQATAEFLIPHIRQAFAMSLVIGEEQIKANVETERHGSRVGAICVVSAAGMLIYANDVAKSLIEKEKVFAIGRSDRLHMLDVNCALDYQVALFGMLSPSSIRPTITTGFLPELGTFEMRFAKIEPFEVPIPFSFSPDKPVLLITLAEHRHSIDQAGRLEKRFGLTSAEASIIERFSCGHPLRDISIQRQVSVNTVRNQMKNAMQKMGVSTQVELMRLLRHI